MSEEPGSERTQVIGPPAAGPAPSRANYNALPIGTRLGEFEIVDLVGEGGFGIVYLAQDHSLHRKVALKEYMPSLLAARGQDKSVSVRSERQRETFDLGLRSFVNEARMLAQFDHPALVKVYRFWEDHGTAYMVMPFYAGQTLQDALRDRKDPPDEAWIRALLSPLMEALAVLHADKVYHRDVAPDNIMLLADDRPVLLDFGAARRVISDVTHALTVILKPGYAPIEQYADVPGMKQGPWTDVYALAAVVYSMIHGRKPPPAVSRMMEDGYEPLAKSAAAGRYSERLLQGIDLCLSVRPERRPQSMAAMRELIDGVAAPAGAASPEPDIFIDVTEAPAAPAPKAVLARPPASQPAKPAARDASTDVHLDLAEPRVSGNASIYSDVHDLPPPARRSKLPLAVGGGVALVALLGAGYVLQARRPAAPAPSVAAAAPAVQPSAPVAVPAPPPAPRITSLPAAIDAARAAADPLLAATVDAPASLPAGSDLKLSVRSPSDGLVYVFAWDQGAEKVYRLTPDEKEGGNVVKAGGSISVTHKGAEGGPASGPAGGWRVVSMVSQRPRDFSAAAFVREGDLQVAERAALESRMAAGGGLASLFGAPQCPAGESCPDRFAIGVADIAKVEAPPAPVARKVPAPKAAAKPPGNEREYMKRLNQDLDKMLGK